MNSSEIKMMLTKVVSDLQYIHRSKAFGVVIDSFDGGLELGETADNALIFARALRAEFSRALVKLDHLDPAHERVYD